MVGSLFKQGIPRIMTHNLKKNAVNCGGHAYIRLIVLKNKLCARCYVIDIEGRHYIGRLQLERTYKDMFGYITCL